MGVPTSDRFHMCVCVCVCGCMSVWPGCVSVCVWTWSCSLLFVAALCGYLVHGWVTWCDHWPPLYVMVQGAIFVIGCLSQVPCGSQADEALGSDHQLVPVWPASSGVSCLLPLLLWISCSLGNCFFLLLRRVRRCNWDMSPHTGKTKL